MSIFDSLSNLIPTRLGLAENLELRFLLRPLLSAFFVLKNDKRIKKSPYLYIKLITGPTAGKKPRLLTVTFTSLYSEILGMASKPD